MHQPELLVLIEFGNLPFYLRWMPSVVSIEKSNKVPGRILNSPISRGRDARFVLPNIPDQLAKNLDLFARIVRRAIVYNQNFRDLIRLVKNAFYRVRNILPVVVSRNYYRNLWLEP